MTMDEEKLLERIVVDSRIFNGKPIIRGRRLAVEHVLGMLAAGDTPETILAGYPWLELEDIQACLIYARRLVGREQIFGNSKARSCFQPQHGIPPPTSIVSHFIAASGHKALLRIQPGQATLPGQFH